MHISNEEESVGGRTVMEKPSDGQQRQEKVKDKDTKHITDQSFCGVRAHDVQTIEQDVPLKKVDSLVIGGLIIGVSVYLARYRLLVRVVGANRRRMSPTNC